MSDIENSPLSRAGLGARLSAAVASRRRTLIAGSAVAVIAIASGGGAVFAATRGESDSYRTAPAETADVTETLALTGQVSSGSSADAAFQVAGDIASVLVAMGDEVTAGQQLATLDTTALDEAVTAAEDAVASAEQTLEDDLEAQASGSSSSSSSESGSSSSTPTAPGGSAASGDSGDSGAADAGDGASGADGADGADGGDGPDGGDADDGSAGPDGSSGSDGSDGTDDPEGSGGSDGTDGSDDGSNGADDEETQAALAAVTTAQQSLLAEYEASTAAQTSTDAALGQAQEICEPFLSATFEGVSVDSDAQSDADATIDDTGDADGAVDEPVDGAADEESEDANGSSRGSGALQAALDEAQAQLAACQAAVTASQDAQSLSVEANAALLSAAATLDEAVAELQEILAGASAEGTAEGSDDTADPPGAIDSDDTADSEDAAGDENTDGDDDTAGDQSGAATTGSSPLSGGVSISATTATIVTAAAAVPDEGTGSGAESAEGASTTVTAERILADRAAIDVAEAELSIAQQNLTFASLSSPIAGTVVAVGFAVGDSVDAASDTAVITVQGEGGYLVESTVSLAKIGKIEAGQTAEVTLPAFSATYTATVGSIGVLNVSETATPTYTVALSLETADEEPRIGATADARVELTTASGVLTVPTSAVTFTGNEASVSVLRDGVSETVSVTAGAVGSERTEITDGLSDRDTVVLADLDAAISSDEDAGSTGLTGLGGSTSEFPSRENFVGGGNITGGDVPTPPGG
ncbi:MAG TPA: HlyD family efflux transporter periplasmic adaptor subunit [Microbacterium sp.]|nr:HlyD family efflux transporter periplasmic adaptor subunit [Microbacterium sp.]